MIVTMTCIRLSLQPEPQPVPQPGPQHAPQPSPDDPEEAREASTTPDALQPSGSRHDVPALQQPRTNPTKAKTDARTSLLETVSKITLIHEM